MKREISPPLPPCPEAAPGRVSTTPRASLWEEPKVLLTPEPVSSRLIPTPVPRERSLERPSTLEVPHWEVLRFVELEPPRLSVSPEVCPNATSRAETSEDEVTKTLESPLPAGPGYGKADTSLALVREFWVVVTRRGS